jgi:hypothetical protein
VTTTPILATAEELELIEGIVIALNTGKYLDTKMKKVELALETKVTSLSCR